MSDQREPTRSPSREIIQLESRDKPPQSDIIDDLRFLSRLLLGVVVLGGEEILERLGRRTEEIAVEPDSVRLDEQIQEEDNLDYLRYLGIGLFSRGQRFVGKGLRRGYDATIGFSKWLVGTVDRTTDYQVFRPWRRPVQVRLQRLGREIESIIREGRQEEQIARQVTKGTISTSFEEIMDQVSSSPELAQMIRGQVSQQSTTLAGEVRDRTRLRALRADDFSERFFRRLFRLTPREELPPSPLEAEALSDFSSHEGGG